MFTYIIVYILFFFKKSNNIFERKWETVEMRNKKVDKLGQWIMIISIDSILLDIILEHRSRRRRRVMMICFHNFFVFFSTLKKYNSINYYSYSLYVFLVVYLLLNSACVFVIFCFVPKCINCFTIILDVCLSVCTEEKGK